ncbi:MAG: SAM-dependent methyltransferase [Gammaproteobacteria bacterium]|nr:SAM-dependent methyltransferase [Gammaproteobacteria bacterium]
MPGNFLELYNMIKLDLPHPDDDAIKHSAKLSALIRNRIEANAGWIDFSEFMLLALYEPDLGYYSAGLQKFGESGDFITAPELSPLFAQTLANPIATTLSVMNSAFVVEFGAGSGVLAANLLLQLEALGALPEKYLIIELSAELQQRQSQTIMQMASHLHERVLWLQKLPEQPISAVVIANEVLDAMPATRFVKRNGKFFPLGVMFEDNGFVLRAGEQDAQLQQRLANIEQETDVSWCDGYTSEINLNIAPWLQSVAAMLHEGSVYLIDYGYPRTEFYLPERAMGTLMCYYRHRSFDDPLRYPGLQDITAFVDFTAVAEAAVEAGLDVEGFTSQANFLLDCGLPDLLQQKLGDNERSNLIWIQQMKSLTLPSEMGERFKVMLLTKNIHLALPGFGLQDMRYRL